MNAGRKQPSRGGLRAVAGVVLLLAVSLLAGCTDFLSSASPRPTLNAVVADETRPIDVTAGPGFIRYEGHLTTPVRCQEMRAKLDRYSESNGVIDLVVEAKALEGCPNRQETTWNYIGNLQSVPPGDYSVTLTHRFVNQDGPTRTVFEGQLTVTPR